MHKWRPWFKSNSMMGMLTLGAGVLLNGINAPVAVAAEACQSDFEPFIRQMLPSLPAYTNRVNTRAGNTQNYMILAGGEDFTALPTKDVSFPNSDQNVGVRQVFFSTLIKRFSQNAIRQHQEYHWLFMAPSDRGWEFVQMYSIPDRYPSEKISSPPRNSSTGSVATAIKDWLKTCHYQATS